MKKLVALLVLAFTTCNTAYAVPPDHAVAMGAGVPMAYNTAAGSAVSQACDIYGTCQVFNNGRSDPASTFQSCSSAATTTADTAIKAAVAANRMYVTSISCSNVSAVSSRIQIKDGATVIYVGSVGTLAATGGRFDVSLPTPLRGTVNTALNFNMVTNATDTVCCAAGYISTL